MKKGLEDRGLELASQAGHQLWSLNAVRVPEGVDEATMRKKMLLDFNIEIGFGSRPPQGKNLARGIDGRKQPEGKRGQIPARTGENPGLTFAGPKR